jgi:hypothetical protein
MGRASSGTFIVTGFSDRAVVLGVIVDFSERPAFVRACVAIVDPFWVGFDFATVPVVSPIDEEFPR